MAKNLMLFLLALCLIGYATTQAQTAIFTEDFENMSFGDLPVEWTHEYVETSETLKFKVAENGGFDDGSSSPWSMSAHSVSNAIFCGENWVGSGPTTYTVYTPDIDLSNATAPALSFYETRGWDAYWSSSLPTPITVHSYCYVVIKEAGAAAVSIATLAYDLAEIKTWKTITGIDLSAYIGKVIKIGFKMDYHVYNWGIDDVSVTDGGATNIENENNLPVDFSLSQNYPNPFNPSTHISYSIVTRGMVNLSVFNILGQKVASLVNEVKSPGAYDVEWNAGGLPSGMYFYRLESVSGALTKKILLVK